MTKYPIYIPSKARADSRLTVKMLEAADVPYRVVIQPQDYEEYSSVIARSNILVLPFNDNQQGLLRARNWIWEHSQKEGHERHWQLDDNIRHMYQRLGKKRQQVNVGWAIGEMERFTDRYSNVAQAGPTYLFLMKQGAVTSPQDHPFRLNTRIYSFTLNLNSLPYRYRAAYNDDTDMSLQCLKDGWCTVLFLIFGCSKIRTMALAGGNTDVLYHQDAGFDGRLEMAKSLVRQHPDVTKITRKWGRYQHQVDYRPFRANKLKFKPEYLNGKTEIRD